MGSKKDRPIDQYHTLICGVTLCGKTTLAHKLASFDEADKKKIVVYDPVLTPTAAGEWPRGAAVFDDRQKFLRYIAKTNDPETAIYIDEAADVFSHDQPENRWILTRGRHLGYSVTLICQRPTMVGPSCRNQCTRLALFRLARSDLQAIGKDFGHSDLHNENLDRGDFICAHSGSSQTTRANIFDLVKKSRGAEWKAILTQPDQEKYIMHEYIKTALVVVVVMAIVFRVPALNSVVTGQAAA